VIKLSDGTKIYHAGDTDFIPEMKNLKVDIALLPVSGTYVMTADEAVQAANTFKPEIAIPMHFGDIVGDESDAEKFKNGFQGATIIKTIEK
jgi:L-ascorbate metabolism protein UlaG (beta-lactamase superfamily)